MVKTLDWSFCDYEFFFKIIIILPKRESTRQQTICEVYIELQPEVNSCLELQMLVSGFLQASSELGKQTPQWSQPLMTLCQSCNRSAFQDGSIWRWIYLTFVHRKGEILGELGEFRAFEEFQVGQEEIVFSYRGLEPRMPVASSFSFRGLQIEPWDPFWGRSHLPICTILECLG